jgi:hypothetical protein
MPGTERKQVGLVGDTTEDLAPVTNAPTEPIGNTLHGENEDLTFTGEGFDAAPVNKIVPVITGTATEDEVLSVDQGVWSSQRPIVSFAYAWQRDGSPIAGADEASYTLVTADVDAEVSCIVTATDSAGETASVETAAVGPVEAAEA